MPQVFIPAQWRDLTEGQNQLAIEAGTLRQVIEQLDARFPGISARIVMDDRIRPTLQVSIDGTLTSLGLRSEVSTAREIHFLPALGGG
ncbi:MAG: MoaD/ThiS family protein [Pirellulaceae bacterium]